MGTPHKHAELIKAWADGAEIEVRISPYFSWAEATTPSWSNGYEYRIKPEPKPDVVKYMEASVINKFGVNRDYNTSQAMPQVSEDSNLKLTFDGETGKLKSAEVL